jgi:hypothetical protein
MTKTAQYWIDQLATDVDWAKSALMEHGQIMPIFIMHPEDSNNDKMMFIVGFRSDEHKSAVFHLMQIVAMAIEAAGVTMITEGWMKQVHVHSGETRDEATRRGLAGGSPQQAEDRIEVLVITQVYRNEEGERAHMAGLYPMMRNAQNKLTGFGDDMGVGALGGQGSVYDLLQPKKPSEREVIAANTLMMAQGEDIMESLHITAFGVHVERATVH